MEMEQRCIYQELAASADHMTVPFALGGIAHKANDVAVSAGGDLTNFDSEHIAAWVNFQNAHSVMDTLADIALQSTAS